MADKLHFEFQQIINDYDAIPEFLENYKELSIIEFNYYTVNNLSLFLVHEDIDFDNIEEVLNKFEFTLPSIKRIFAKPIIHLKEDDEVLPVENVRLINNSTINHIATHSELWDDYDERGIKPLKLLTRTYQDNYSIYENILFAKTVDFMLQYLHKHMRILKNLMYSCKIIEFNLLEKINHWDYFLALGKLHIGYVRDFGKYYTRAKDIYLRMSLISDSLTARLKRNVYRLNHKKTGNIQLHNSNILHMQKDYHRVYLLYKNYKKSNDNEIEITKPMMEKFFQNYFSYLIIITIFAILHFNFTCDEHKKFSLDSLNMDFEFKDWKLHTALSKNKKGIFITVTKDSTYKIVIVPSNNKNLNFAADEIVYVTPFMEQKKYEYISISDVESFRRIQRIIQRAMILSDSKFDTCLFCGEKLNRISLDDEPNEYVCNSCRTHIMEKKCELTNEKYYITSIYDYKIDNEAYDDPSSIYHYRNITNVTKNGEFICPKCGKVH